MARTLHLGGLDDAIPPLPPQLVTIAQPELPGLADEIVAEIRNSIPEYARPIDGPYGQTLKIGVESAINGFVSKLLEPDEPQDRSEEMCRRLGRFEAQEGRSMDGLQSAYRVGVHVAWRRMMRIGRKHDLQAEVMTRLADVLFGYINDLSALSLEGYLEAKTKSSQRLRQERRRLLGLILERPPVSEEMIRDLAVLAEWDVPAQMSLVALGATADCTRSLLDDDLLAELDAPEPYLLIPGEMTGDRSEMLRTALGGSQAAVGPPVPLANAADSLRWARQALALAREKVIDDGPITLCEDHLVTLWLMADGPLIDQIARRRLAPMGDLTSRQRRRLLDTLRTWLATRGTVTQIAEYLGVHPQTVRYRIRQIEQTLGEELEDPDTRFSIEVVLRAIWLRERGMRRRGIPLPGLDDDEDGGPRTPPADAPAEVPTPRA